MVYGVEGGGSYFCVIVLEERKCREKCVNFLGKYCYGILWLEKFWLSRWYFEFYLSGVGVFYIGEGYRFGRVGGGYSVVVWGFLYLGVYIFIS